MDGMIVMLVRLAVVIVHVAHHEKMSQRAKQCQPHIDDCIDGDFQEQDSCQTQNGKQAAKQHDPDMTFIHVNLPLPFPLYRRKGNNEIAIFYFSSEFIQRTRRRTADHITNHIKMTVMAGTDVMSLVRMPGNTTAKVGANVREYPYFTFTLTQNEQAIVGCRPFPSVDPGAGKFKPGWNANRISFKRAKIDD